jgi:hypothetical protein
VISGVAWPDSWTDVGLTVCLRGRAPFRSHKVTSERLLACQTLRPSQQAGTVPGLQEDPFQDFAALADGLPVSLSRRSKSPSLLNGPVPKAPMSASRSRQLWQGRCECTSGRSRWLPKCRCSIKRQDDLRGLSATLSRRGATTASEPDRLARRLQPESNSAVDACYDCEYVPSD